MFGNIKVILNDFSTLLWTVPLPVLMLLIGAFYTVKTNFFQVRNLKKSIYGAFDTKAESKDGISPFASVCTALSATVGTGNIAGVAGAISLGGAGAIFWMWVTAFFGMIIKLCECILAIRFREKSDGAFIGGPMYYIKNGIRKRSKILAYLYSTFGILTALGTGNAVQVNTVADSVSELVSGINQEYILFIRLIVGILIAVLSGIVLLGGVKRISSAAEAIVPAMVVLYLLLTGGIIIARIKFLPSAVLSIFYGAFSPKAVTGGAIGSVFLTVQKGISRGVFTHESGLGTSAMAYASVDTDNPVKQGMFGIFEVFIDTIVISSLTAFSILCCNTEITYGVDMGVTLTLSAFATVYGRFARPLLTVPICIFAFASVIGWGYYGTRCAEFLFGKRFIKPFLILFCASSLLGVIKSTESIWLLSEVCNGLMALPNLAALFWLSPIVLEEIKVYELHHKKIRKNSI